MHLVNPPGPMSANAPSVGNLLSAPVPSERLVRLPEALSIVGMGRSMWLAQVKAGKAPKPVKYGPRVACWVLSELHGFVAQRVAERRP